MKAAIILEILLLGSAEAGNNFWWLAKDSAFGGRNYDLEDVVAGEHIRKPNTSTIPPEARVKRQSDIEPDDIESECPVGEVCIERFLCGAKNVNHRLDIAVSAVPCYMSEKNKFGVCCNDPEPRVCPDNKFSPPRENCLLAEPECGRSGQQSTCEGDGLCCFNGCTNVCVGPKRYHRPENPFFNRGTDWRVVGRRPSKSNSGGRGSSSSGSSSSSSSGSGSGGKRRRPPKRQTSQSDLLTMSSTGRQLTSSSSLPISSSMSSSHHGKVWLRPLRDRDSSDSIDEKELQEELLRLRDMERDQFKDDDGRYNELWQKILNRLDDL